MDTLNDLNKMLDNHKRIKSLLENEREYLIERYGPSGYKTKTSYLDADCIRSTDKKDLADFIDEVNRIDNNIYIEECMIARFEKDIQAIKDEISKLTGKECKIREMQLVEGKNLKQIAKEINHEYGYVRKIAAKNKWLDDEE